MKLVEDVYKASFFKNRHKLHWRAEHVCCAIISILEPSSIIDVGCGTGDLVEYFNEIGVKAWGIEGSKRALPFVVSDKIFIFDIRDELDIDYPRFDLCLSLEVAEHIDPDRANQYIKNLVQLSNKVLISAAPIGQLGHGHVNCQPYEYWIKKFSDRNYEFIPAIAEMIKQQLFPWRHKPGIKAYYNNLLYFERRTNHV